MKNNTKKPNNSLTAFTTPIPNNAPRIDTLMGHINQKKLPIGYLFNLVEKIDKQSPTTTQQQMAWN